MKRFELTPAGLFVFDKDGSMYLSPSVIEQRLNEFPELDANPTLRAQVLELIERDRAEREAREAARAVE